MKKMRKIVPAFAMLMVAAIMMSTASFAWFSMNTEATATGMEIKAKSTGGLAIASYTTGGTEPADESYKSSAEVDWSNEAKELTPTSHSGTKWYTATAAEVDSYEAGANSDGLKYTVVSGNQYYLETKWSIKTLAEGMQADVSLTGITVEGIGSTNANVNLAKALRVAVYTEDLGWLYFAPNHDSGTTLYYVADPDTDDEDQVKAGGVRTSTTAITCGTPNVVVLEDVTTDAEAVSVYIYFEGEDGNCMSANAIDLQTISVELKFAAGRATAVPSAPAEDPEET